MEKPVLTLELGGKSSEFVLLNDIFTAKGCVLLDSCTDGIISSIDKIECDSSSIYILDKVMEKCVYRFSEAGKYCNRIGVCGRGKGEYINIYDFTVEPKNGNIIILGEDSKVYVYDKNGKFIGDKKLSETRFWNIQATDDGILMSTNHSTYASGENSFLLYEYDFSFNLINKWNQALPEYNTYMPPMSSFVFQKHEDGLSYIDQKQNRIFLQDKGNGSFDKFIDVSFPNPRPFSHYTDAMVFMDKNNQRKYDWLCEVLLGEDKIMTTYFRNGRYCVSVADAKDGRIIKEGILAGIMPRIYPLRGNDYIAAVTPEIYDKDKSWRMFSKDLKHGITDESNLLLVKLRLK